MSLGEQSYYMAEREPVSVTYPAIPFSGKVPQLHPGALHIYFDLEPSAFAEGGAWWQLVDDWSENYRDHNGRKIDVEETELHGNQYEILREAGKIVAYKYWSDFGGPHVLVTGENPQKAQANLDNIMNLLLKYSTRVAEQTEHATEAEETVVFEPNTSKTRAWPQPATGRFGRILQPAQPYRQA